MITSILIDAITLVHLPDGPTAYFKLTSIELTQQIFVRLLPSLTFTSASNLIHSTLPRATPVQPHTIRSLS